METKYMKDKNGTIKKIKPMIVFPRHYDKTFTLLKQMFGIDINDTIFDDENTDRFEDVVNQIEQTGEDYAKDILTRSRNEDNRVYTD